MMPDPDPLRALIKACEEAQVVLAPVRTIEAADFALRQKARVSSLPVFVPPFRLWLLPFWRF